MDEKTLVILAMAFRNTLGNDSLTYLLEQMRMAAEQLESNTERNAARAFADCLSDRMQAHGGEGGREQMNMDSMILAEDRHDHDVVGRIFTGIGGVQYFCDSYDPSCGYWMTSTVNSNDRRNVSERAIGRTFHRDRRPGAECMAEKLRGRAAEEAAPHAD